MRIGAQSKALVRDAQSITDGHFSVALRRIICRAKLSGCQLLWPCHVTLYFPSTSYGRHGLYMPQKEQKGKKKEKKKQGLSNMTNELSVQTLGRMLMRIKLI